MKNLFDKKMNLLFAVVFIFLLLSFSGCASLFSQKNPIENSEGKNVKVTPKSFESPTEYGIAFGIITSYRKERINMLNPISWFRPKNIGFENIEFLQINPAMRAMRMIPMIADKDGKNPVHYTSPQPVGIHFYSTQITRGYTETIQTAPNVTSTQTYSHTYTIGLQESPNSINMHIRRPGLNYFGSYKATTGGFVVDDSKNELDALRILRRELRGTSWESVIDARIRELER